MGWPQLGATGRPHRVVTRLRNSGLVCAEDGTKGGPGLVRGLLGKGRVRAEGKAGTRHGTHRAAKASGCRGCSPGPSGFRQPLPAVSS